MATSGKKRTSAFDDAQDGGYQRLLPVRCSADGCPLRAQVFTTPDRGVCEYHFAADTRMWDRVTAILRDPKARRLIRALDALAASYHLSTRATNPIICEVQRAGLDFGMSEETLKMQQLLGWIKGVQGYFIEPAQAYEYRISREFVAEVLGRASERGTFASAREQAMAWTDKALAAIAGRGRQIMDPSNFGREAA